MKKLLLVMFLFVNCLAQSAESHDNLFVKMAEGTLNTKSAQDLSSIDDQFPSSKITREGLAIMEDSTEITKITQSEDGARERQAYVARPMSEIRGISESTELVNLIKKMSNTKLTETLIALNQTEPGLSDAVQHTNQITAEYLDAINTGDIRFRRLMEQYPGLADKYLPAYEGCIAKKMEDGESWTTATLQCSGDNAVDGTVTPLKFSGGQMFDFLNNPDAKTGSGVTAKTVDVGKYLFSKIKITGADVATLETDFKKLFGNIMIEQAEVKGQGAFTVTTKRIKPTDEGLKDFTDKLEEEILDTTLVTLRKYCKKRRDKAPSNADPDKQDFLGKSITDEDRFQISIPGRELDNKLVDDMYQFISFQHDSELDKEKCMIKLFEKATFKEAPTSATFITYSKQIEMIQSYVSFVVSSKLVLTFQKALQIIDLFPVLDSKDDVVKGQAAGMVTEVAGKVDFTTDLEQNIQNFDKFREKLNEINAKNSGQNKKSSGVKSQE